MEEQLTELVERLKTAASGNLEAVVLYGSAVSSDHHVEFSDLNLLCVLREVSAQTLAGLAPAIHWWMEKKHPAPLIFSRTELEQSADVFAIEFLDMKQQHRILYGTDLLQHLQVSLRHHRTQVERELRTKLLLLRQHYLASSGDEHKIRHLMLSSVTNFLTLFRHALITMGEAPPASKREAVRYLGEKLGFDSSPFWELLDIREQRAKADTIDVQNTFSRYLKGIEAVIQTVDALDKEKP
ncbi:MAG: hypothetical protein DMG65_08830 [Candidatus Angelobacter sp. Gp1-AA117]|nr:MAG: hypothetical protein DMG65_08830 [Candidatus Angelobacter sp. Gp1-AA117]